MTYILDLNTVIAADLDGTLAESKSPIRLEMALVLNKWLATRRFAVVSGGAYHQLEKQIISHLPPGTNLDNLFFFPTNGASCYVHSANGWVKLYEELLTDEQKEKITNAFKIAIKNSKGNFTPEKIYGDQIEFRGGQVTFSALGQHAPLDEKMAWDPTQEKRVELASHLSPLLPDFNISLGGATSIDITPKGIDKAFAIKKMMEILNVDTEHIIYLGDALFEGGNDWAVVRTGVTTIQVSDPKDTVEKIRGFMN